jgi:predicted urease superfamily metal-dependent hydrolase
MGRLVFSFSVAEESEAASLLRRWKNEGKVLSHVIQTALEYGAKEQMDLKRELEWEQKSRKQAFSILQGVFGVYPDEFKFMHDNVPSQWQPVAVLKRAKKAIDDRSEFVIHGDD